MIHLFGILLIVVGLAAIVFGTKIVVPNGGVVLRLVRMPRLHVTVVKWAFGLLCIWFGASLLFSGTQA